MTPRQALHDLLIQSFSHDELTRLVKEGPDGAARFAELQTTQSLSVLAGSVIDCWEQRGVVRDELSRLAAERPARASEFEAVQDRWMVAAKPTDRKTQTTSGARSSREEAPRGRAEQAPRRLGLVSAGVVGALGLGALLWWNVRADDSDGDGVPDATDAAPGEPEDRDGFEDDDGRPDPDNDQDGILDTFDVCDNEPEIVNQYNDEDGCPDTAGRLGTVMVTFSGDVAQVRAGNYVVPANGKRPLTPGRYELRVYDASGTEVGTSMPLHLNAGDWKAVVCSPDGCQLSFAPP